MVYYGEAVSGEECVDVGCLLFLSAFLIIAPRLNTFLDLKLENQRLQTRLRELTGSSSPSVMTKGPLPLFTSTSMAGETFDGGSTNGGTVGSSLYATSSLDVHTGGEDDRDDGGKKKKVCLSCGFQWFFIN